MPSTLVLGLSGQVGVALRSARPGSLPPVLAFSRRSQAPAPGVEWRQADLEYTPECPPEIDCILSLGPLDVFAGWLQRSGARPARIVALGSTGARHKHASPDPTDRDAAQRLAHAESVLFDCARERAIAATLLRPTLLYGSGTDSLARLAAFARRTRLLPWPKRATGLRQPVHVDDVGAAVLACLHAPASAGRAFDLPGAEALSFDAMVERHLSVHAPSARLWRLPGPLFALAGGAARLAGRGEGLRGWLARAAHDQVADACAAREAFGYAPRPFMP